MKKRLLLFFTILCLLFTGCTTNEEKPIKNTVSGYLDALQNGDNEKAQSFCDQSYYDALGIQSFTTSLDAQLKEIDLGEDFNKDATAFVKKVIMKSIQSYKIINYTLDNDTATVTVDITGIDFQDVNIKTAEENALTAYGTYIEDHLTELNEILNTKGEEVMKEELTKQLSAMLFNSLNTEIDKTKPKERTVDFFLKKIDGEWKLASPNNGKKEVK